MVLPGEGGEELPGKACSSAALSQTAARGRAGKKAPCLGRCMAAAVVLMLQILPCSTLLVLSRFFGFAEMARIGLSLLLFDSLFVCGRFSFWNVVAASHRSATVSWLKTDVLAEGRTVREREPASRHCAKPYTNYIS